MYYKISTNEEFLPNWFRDSSTGSPLESLLAQVGTGLTRRGVLVKGRRGTFRMEKDLE
jgi:hypothetical protein